mmetsp:Transcript_20411/g.62060  ORF Transcript_20411/g.62060 Transcript_20411/m.62060 type:complete len:211 (-) Transcript_20411:768-1400(-)
MHGGGALVGNDLRRHDAHEPIKLGRVQAPDGAILNARAPLAAVVRVGLHLLLRREDRHEHGAHLQVDRVLRLRQEWDAAGRPSVPAALALDERHKLHLLQDAAVRGAADVAGDAQVHLRLEEEPVVHEQPAQRVAEVRELINISLLLGSLYHDVVVEARVAGVPSLEGRAAQPPDDLVVLAAVEGLVKQRTGLQCDEAQLALVVLQERLA